MLVVRLAMHYIRLKLEQIVLVLIIIFRFFKIITGKSFNTFKVFPSGYGPDVCNVALLSLPDLCTQVAFNRFVIADAGFYHESPVCSRVGCAGTAMPDSYDHSLDFRLRVVFCLPFCISIN